MIDIEKPIDKPHDERTIEALFKGRPEARTLFDLVNNYMCSLGPVKTEIMKTQISFGLEKKFAWVWLPQMWTRKRSETSITLTIFLPRRIVDKRITETVEPSPGKWIHHILLEKEPDFDGEVRGWLSEAYHINNIQSKETRKDR